MLSHDLNDKQYYDHEHIYTILNMMTQIHDYHKFVDFTQIFFLIIIHSTLLNCLSVDIFVKNLYNYISDSNSSWAISFFKCLNTNLINAHLEFSYLTLIISLKKIVIAMSMTICELLKRKQCAIFHNDLSNLINFFKNIAANINKKFTAYLIIIY